MTSGERKRYPSDLTDQQWEIIQELIPRPRKSSKGGRPRSVDMREVVNTILYQCRSGCQWDMLPHDLLAKSTVYDYFATLARRQHTAQDQRSACRGDSDARSTE